MSKSSSHRYGLSSERFEYTHGSDASYLRDSESARIDIPVSFHKFIGSSESLARPLIEIVEVTDGELRTRFVNGPIIQSSISDRQVSRCETEYTDTDGSDFDLSTIEDDGKLSELKASLDRSNSFTLSQIFRSDSDDIVRSKPTLKIISCISENGVQGIVYKALKISNDAQEAVDMAVKVVKI